MITYRVLYVPFNAFNYDYLRSHNDAIECCAKLDLKIICNNKLYIIIIDICLYYHFTTSNGNTNTTFIFLPFDRVIWQKYIEKIIMCIVNVIIITSYKTSKNRDRYKIIFAILSRQMAKINNYDLKIS